MHPMLRHNFRAGSSTLIGRESASDTRPAQASSGSSRYGPSDPLPNARDATRDNTRDNLLCTVRIRPEDNLEEQPNNLRCRRAPQWSGSKAMILGSFQPTTHNLTITERGKLSFISCPTGTLPTSSMDAHNRTLPTTCFSFAAYWKVGPNCSTSLRD